MENNNNSFNLLEINNDFPLIIAGPCSAESEEQVLKTAELISKINNVKYFRAGVWKPRTRPGSFEGAGSKALKWLKKVNETYNLKTCVEIATPDHAKQCIDSGIDVLWIGARTTSNPFSVQQIAESLKNYEKPILIKNPINPDIELWIGAIERFYHVGANNIAGILRGFYPFEKTTLRNIPKWEIAIELKTRMPNLPLICDPSHIAGNTNNILEISQKALDLAFDGLMIESHYNPEVALSDKQQQLTPIELQTLINSLKPYKDSLDADFRNKLDTLRSKIDSIDMQLLELLYQRMKVVDEIGLYKNENRVSIFQLRRWQQIIETRMEYGKKLGLDEEFIKEILKMIHDISIKQQSKQLNRKH